MRLARASRGAVVLAATTFSLAFPALVFFGRDLLAPSSLALVGAALLLARLLLSGGVAGVLAIATLVPALFLAAVALSGDDRAALLYPAVVNGVLLACFAATLARPPSMIERLARLSGMAISPAGIRYTRGVTILWSVFFLVNGSIAAWLALRDSLAAWAMWTGVWGYVAAAVLMAVEFVYRQRYRARYAPTSVAPGRR
jgi:uncharacterized membrane protein